MDELDLIQLFISQFLDNNILGSFNDTNQIKKRKQIIIETTPPEIGTKIENLEENKNLINQKIKKDYYNNENTKVFFYPFFNMEKGNKIADTKYHLVYYYIDDIYNLYILKDSKEEKRKIQINNKSIIRIIYNIIQNDIELYIFLKAVPKVYTKDTNISKSSFFFEKFKNNLKNYDYGNLYRNIDKNKPEKYYEISHYKQILSENSNNSNEIKLIFEKENYQRDVSYFSMDDEYQNLYLNDLIIKISFINNGENKKRFKDLKKYLKYLKVKFKDNQYFYEKINPFEPKMQVQIKDKLEENRKVFYNNLKNLIPNLQFSIMSLLTIHQINIFNFDLEILIFLAKLDYKDQEKAVEILEMMNKKCNYTLRNLDYLSFLKDYCYFKNDFENNYTYDNNKTKSIIITPSKIIYNITTLSTTNHFQRKLIDYNDSIIKINILDEDHDNFCFSDINNSEKLLEFIKTIFKDGIVLGFSHYNYIASSNSQLKNLGGWMINLEGVRTCNEIEIYKNQNKINNNFDMIIINKDKGSNSSFQIYNNCEEILNVFGDFSKEKNIFKNTARKGMIFSDTKYSTDVNIYNVIPLEDEKIGKYIITDGIGKISKDLIEHSTKIWGINDSNLNTISAIQIRFMGCKGVFALDPSLEPNTVHYRESQKKFESDDTALNICSVSNFKEGFLNRQFIILLSTLGVEDKIFENIQDNITKKYLNLLVESSKALINDNFLYYEVKNKLSYFIPTFEYFFKKGVNLSNEPLFSQLIHIFAYSRLIDIKYNGRLSDKKSICLMGVIDETNTLEEDQVYIHLIYSTEISKIDKILNKKVTIYRSPSLHPGDIKILTAVNNPFLGHMINVIVFSKRGKRPIFNKLSGGDLDGDRYFISYNDDITNNIKDTNCESLDDSKYSENNNNNIKTDKITIEDSINCMVKATSNNLIGQLCDTHLSFADESSLKAKDLKCIELCKLFNQEIDASKTGNFINTSIFKEKKLIKKKRPDFLSNGITNKYRIYKSRGILGKLYRKIDKKRLYDKFRNNFFEKAIRRNYIIDKDFITKNCFKYLADAYFIYNDYKIRLCNLMKKYNFCTESELFFSLRIFKNNRGYRGKANSYILEINNLIDYIYNEIKKTFKNINVDVASAIYVASYINVQRVYDKKVYFTDDYKENFGKLMSLFEKEKDDFKLLFNKYEDYAYLKQRNRGENKNKYKRIFSLPWVIEDIRKLLIEI